MKQADNVIDECPGADELRRVKRQSRIETASYLLAVDTGL
jgi:hypothetical protein